MKIEKKTWAPFFQQILDGKKTYDLRLNDFDVNEGDTILFKEYDPKTKTYTGREIEKRITHINKWKIEDLIKFWSKEEIEEKGILIMSLKD